MIIFIHILFIISTSFCYSNSTIPIDHLETEKYAIPLSLESHRKTIFLLNQNFPNITDDIEYLNFKIDGSMNYPLYNSIPKKVFINSSDTLTMSQLSFLQDHSEYFYDTSVALKSYLKENINLLTQFESKSRKRRNYDENKSSKGINYDQKAMMSIYRKNNISSFDVGYMYHYENIPVYTGIEDYPNEASFRSIESYNFKMHYEFFGDRIKFGNASNLQMANYLRPLDSTTSNNTEDYIEYLSQIIWNKADIDYFLSQKYIFNFQSNYKFIKSDVSDSNFFFNQYYCKNSLGFTIKHKINDFRFGINNFNNKKNYHYFHYMLNLNKFTFFISKDNNVYMNVDYIDNDYFINRAIANNQFLGFSFKNAAISTSLSIGHYDIENYTYFYYRLNTKLIYGWVSIDFSYNVYDTKKIFLNNYMGLSIKVSPDIKNKRYRPYAKIKFNNLSVSNMYQIGQNQLSFYNKDILETSGFSGINITDIELGVVFNYFKIALIYENYYDKPFVYGNDFSPNQNNSEYFLIQNESNYLVEITWIFKE